MNRANGPGPRSYATHANAASRGVQPSFVTMQMAIVDMVRVSIPVQSCIRRISNWCLCNGVEITEGNGRLVDEFGRIVKPAYVTFLRDAIEVIHVCGFVPWIVAEQDGARFPRVLPLGCFAWHVEVVSDATVDAHIERGNGNPEGSKRRRVSDVYRYRVTIMHGDIDESRVRIIDWMPPRAGAACVSPLQGVYENYIFTQQTREMLHNIAMHNCRKHIYFSEQINTQQLNATSGLNLLDDFRRYALTGERAAAPAGHVRMQANNGRPLNSANDAHMHWIHETFDHAIAAHVLPPNTEAHEIQPIAIDDHHLHQDTVFQHTVHTYFDLPYSVARSTITEKATQHEQLLSEEQYTNIRNMCNFLQFAAERTYTEIFKVSRVQVRLRARPRISMSSADDVKKLFECQVFTQRDVFQLRSMFLNQ